MIGPAKKSQYDEVEHHRRRKIQLAKGVSLAGLILLVMTSALAGFATIGFATLWWTILFFMILFACTLAAPTALRLLKEGLIGVTEAEPSQRRVTDRVDLIAAQDSNETSMKSDERQLLEVIERHGKTTPARAALETPLTVDEADRLLSELAQKGHLQVRVEEGKVVYTL
jgi:hypothetical protein